MSDEDARDAEMSAERDTDTGMSAERDTDTGMSAERDTGDRERLVDKVTTVINYAVLAGLLLLAFIAVVQFYLSAQSTINTWVTPEFRAPFRALFNLVVLLIAGLGISYQLRRLMGRSESTESE